MKILGAFLRRNSVAMKKEQAIEKLKRQLGIIEELRGESPESAKFQKWERDTRVAFKNIFETGSQHLLEFINIEYYREPTWNESRFGGIRGNPYLEGLEKAKVLLRSCIDEIDEYWPDGEPESKQEVKGQEQLGSDIFIVHGHDESAKQTVARFIDKLDLNPIILHEQPNAGRTVIEKFEDYSNVGFSVVLMSPDDVGGSVDDKDNLRLRSRQNVVFELGFFLGKLGRKRVCALYKEGVEIPSDYQGVLFVPMDKDGGWKLSLAKEIKAAGISIDLNKAID